jgi:hypothetical protein
MLKLAGIDGFLMNAEERRREADAEETEWAEFLLELHQRVLSWGSAITVARVRDEAERDPDFAEMIPGNARQTLDRGAHQFGTILGREFGRMRDRPLRASDGRLYQLLKRDREGDTRAAHLWNVAVIVDSTKSATDRALQESRAT